MPRRPSSHVRAEAKGEAFNPQWKRPKFASMQEPVAAAEHSQCVRATSAIMSRMRAPATAKAVMFGLMQVRGGAIRATLPGGQTLLFADDEPAPVSLKTKDYRFP